MISLLNKNMNNHNETNIFSCLDKEFPEISNMHESRPKKLTKGGKVKYTKLESSKVYSEQVSRDINPKKIDIDYTENSDNFHLLYKTRVCNQIKQGKVCKYGSKCDFAHTADELNVHECKYGFECKNFYNNNECEFLHPDETKTEYIFRVMPDIYSQIIDNQSVSFGGHNYQSKTPKVKVCLDDYPPLSAPKPEIIPERPCTPIPVSTPVHEESILPEPTLLSTAIQDNNSLLKPEPKVSTIDDYNKILVRVPKEFAINALEIAIKNKVNIHLEII